MQNPIVKEPKVKYKKCPDCRNFMARVNYRQRSGIIIDRCMSCGYWLDAGELRQMMEWAKLSGVKDFRPTLSLEEKPIKRFSPSPLRTNTVYKPYHHKSNDVVSDIIDGVLSALYWL